MLDLVFVCIQVSVRGGEEDREKVSEGEQWKQSVIEERRGEERRGMRVRVRVRVRGDQERR
jgi:hypothetical protein